MAKTSKQKLLDEVKYPFSRAQSIRKLQLGLRQVRRAPVIIPVEQQVPVKPKVILKPVAPPFIPKHPPPPPVFMGDSMDEFCEVP